MYVQTSRKADDSDETHFVFTLEQPYDINHLTAFLTGGTYFHNIPLNGKKLTTVPFPEGYGASVHFAWPNKDYIPLGVYVHPYVLIVDLCSGLLGNKAGAGAGSRIKDLKKDRA